MSQILNFRLTDNNIFEFKYSKYSEFIDNLEPEPDVIIDVLEPFTLEDFETAQIEYYKYVVFKEALEDIIKNKNLRSKEELKELSKYELNNPVLEWLMIMETRDEKEIKEKLSLKSFELEHIDKDNIILYSFINKSIQDKFNNTCRMGHLKSAQWLYNLHDENKVDDEKINIHWAGEEPFREACKNGHLEVAQWLYNFVYDESVEKLNFSWYEHPFREACRNGHFEMVQWLYGIGIYALEPDYFTFRFVCNKGYFEIAKWLYTNFEIDITFRGYEAFRWACDIGHFELVQWYSSLKEFRKQDIDPVFTKKYHIQDWLTRKGIFWFDKIN